ASQAQDIRWLPFEEALSKAKESERPVLVDVWAPWCGWCHKMKKEVYPELNSMLNKEFVLTRLNRDDHNTTYTFGGTTLNAFKLARTLKTRQVPAIVLLSPEGHYLLHLEGFIQAENLQPVLQYVASGAYRQQTYREFLANN
ncbi:MAG: DUF255 domain-containing protein, partial [Balneolaceae bacterium]|nr:DUF255 domain-containing protein [Balneolaceae bacterium]